MACSLAVISFVRTNPCCSLAEDFILDLPNKDEALFFSDSLLELLESLQSRQHHIMA